jgi:hypothetical protein
VEAIECPTGDTGRCVVPDPTVVLDGGSMAIRSRESIERAFPDLDITRGKLRPADLPPSLQEVLAGDAEPMAPGEWRRRDPATGSQAAREDSDEDPPRLLVNCSCGHQFFWEP